MKIASPDVITEAFYKLTGNLLAGSETNVHPLTHPPGKVVKGATQPISLHFCVTSHGDHTCIATKSRLPRVFGFLGQERILVPQPHHW